jgi:hypothetical protein
VARYERYVRVHVLKELMREVSRVLHVNHHGVAADEVSLEDGGREAAGAVRRRARQKRAEIARALSAERRLDVVAQPADSGIT